ncbi:anion permease, partial [Mycobacterium tuberculosis]|nr:anion permease [Mycobacterium tuberculosis]
ASYGADTIFLFMGGFMLALAMQRWNLHRRIALSVLATMGSKTANLIAGFMIATGFLSMWVSNTATAVMMLPIGISVLM